MKRLGHSYAVFDESLGIYVKGLGTSNNRKTFRCGAWQNQSNSRKIKPLAFNSINQIQSRINKLNKKLGLI